MSNPAPVITFLSDYGLEDDFVGVCHGVIARLCPAARVIDLTHGVARHDVRSGALILLAHAVYIDRFGNVGLSVEHDDLAALGVRLGRPVGLEASGRSETATYARTFADVEVGGLLVYEDAYKRLSVAVSHGSAAAL